MSTNARYLERKLRSLFPSAKAKKAALAELLRYGVSASEPEPDRVRLAVLKLAGSDIEKLRETVDGAKEDWEDIINWAERPAATRCHLENRKLHDEQRRKLEQEDTQQWEQWLSQKDS